MKIPMMDRVEASTSLEEAEETRKIPIIALTASGLEGDDERVRKTCDAHLMKPIRWGERIVRRAQDFDFDALEELAPELEASATELDQIGGSSRG